MAKSWVVVAGYGQIMGGCGWLWMVAPNSKAELLVVIQSPMSIIYECNFVDLALIMAFSLSTVIIIEY